MILAWPLSRYAVSRVWRVTPWLSDLGVSTARNMGMVALVCANGGWGNRQGVDGRMGTSLQSNLNNPEMASNQLLILLPRIFESLKSSIDDMTKTDDRRRANRTMPGNSVGSWDENRPMRRAIDRRGDNESNSGGSTGRTSADRRKESQRRWPRPQLSNNSRGI